MKLYGKKKKGIWKDGKRIKWIEEDVLIYMKDNEI